MKDKTLKYLEEEFKNEFKFENIDKLKLTYELIEDIGNKDSHLRDNVIYPSLAHLLRDKHFENEEMKKIAEILISDQYLSFDMDNKNEYSVLKRTFTSLQIAMLVYVHNRDKLFDKEFVKKMFNSVVEYYINEKDIRGYEPAVGWIHSVAHAADIFAQLVKCDELDVKDFEYMLDSINNKFKVNTYTFVSHEDERTVNAIFNLLEKDIISKETLLKWVNDLGDYERPKTYPEVYRINNNVKNLLRSLYFRVLDNKKYLFLTDEIKKVLEEKVKLK